MNHRSLSAFKAIVCVALAVSSATSEDNRQALSAQSANALQSLTFVPKNSSSTKDHPVTLSFSGRLYTASTAPDSLDPSERLVMSVVSINKTGDLDEILRLWASDERDAIRRAAADPQIMSANKAYYAAIQSTDLCARIEYGSYILFIVRHSVAGSSPRMKTYPLKPTKDGHLFTNELADDPVFVHLSATLETRLKSGCR